VKRPKVVTDLLAVDDTGTVANYIRHLEGENAELETQLAARDATLARQREALLSVEDALERELRELQRLRIDTGRVASSTPETPEVTS
jgi:hypothetical protein